MLAAEILSNSTVSTSSWFRRWDNDLLAEEGLRHGVSPTEFYSQFVGPRQFQLDNWIVQFTDRSVRQLTKMDQAIDMLNGNGVTFQIVAGLGLPGMLHVQSLSSQSEVARESLRLNPNVAAFSANDELSSQAIPNDPLFSNMRNLKNQGQFGGTQDADINAPAAWGVAPNVFTGSPSVVVGIIDSGVDLAHEDLFLNIWINQGEIPRSVRAKVEAKLGTTSNPALITFYDLNKPEIKSIPDLFIDYNNNQYIDAIDLLQDPVWADGIDTDGNEFIDDLFGWNFLSGSNDPFATNNPSDASGHGTHVAGTIGAIGNNQKGVTGVNWQTSIMSLRFLDESNRGDTASAIAAINYATRMRTEYNTNVRVLNNSWGQTGGSNVLLKNAIDASGEAGILFVAAAGNGNILGAGIDNDRSPFYPASYDSSNIIAVAATDSNDQLASFSNFGLTSVDAAAPGIGVYSTLPGNRYGTANGTSMAAPHVTGTAALIWASQPDATVQEVRKAILNFGDSTGALVGRIQSGKRLDANASLQADTFAPLAKLLSAPDVTQIGGTSTIISVQFETKNSQAIDFATIGDGDVVVQPLSFASSEMIGRLVPGSVVRTNNDKQIRASYLFDAPGGAWDVLDTGFYRISVTNGSVVSKRANQAAGLPVNATALGQFAVRLAEGTGLFYATTFLDTLDANPGDGKCEDANGACSIRAAVQESNAKPTQSFTLVLSQGTYSLGISPVWKATDDFPLPKAEVMREIGLTADSLQWSDEKSGDFDVRGKLTLLGSGWNQTTIDGQSKDRLFKVYPSGSLELRRMTLTDGNARQGRIGGAILSSGSFSLTEGSIVDSVASQGSALAAWHGQLNLTTANIMGNSSDSAVFIADRVIANVKQSSIVRNFGGGVRAIDASMSKVENTTISENVTYTVENDVSRSYGKTERPSISADGRYTVIATFAQLDLRDSNNSSDLYLYDRLNDTFELISLDSATQRSNNQPNESPVISADGRFIAFIALGNLTNETHSGWRQVFVFDRQSKVLKRATSDSDRVQGNDTLVLTNKQKVTISNDGRHIAFASQVPGENEGIFVKDLTTGIIRILGRNRNVYSDEFRLEFSSDGQSLAYSVVDVLSGIEQVFASSLLSSTPPRLVSSSSSGVSGNRSSVLGSISADGNEVVFTSIATNLDSIDSTGQKSVYIKNLATGTLSLVSKGVGNRSGNGPSNSGRISRDGKKVAFVSMATNLLPSGETPMEPSLFLLDRESGKIDRSVSSPDGIVGIDMNLDASVIAYTASPGMVGQFTSHPGGLYLFDVRNNKKDLPMGPEVDSFELKHVTLKGINDTGAIPSGVRVINSIVASDLIENASIKIPLRVSGNNVVDRLQVLETLASSSYGTWSHAIPRYSRAWDAADAVYTTVFDQQGNQRIGNSIAFGNGFDVGAIELTSSSIQGILYRDFDNAETRATGEVGMPGIDVFVDLNLNGLHEPSEPNTVTNFDDPATLDVNESGYYEFPTLPTGAYSVLPALDANWTRKGFLYSPTILSNSGGSNPSLSSNGRFVAFESDSNNLVSGDLNQSTDVFVLDRETRSIERVSMTRIGLESNGNSKNPHLSGDGRYVVFESTASNLNLDASTKRSVFLHDRVTKTLTQLDTKANGDAANGFSLNPKISMDGTHVVFESTSTQLVNSNTNGSWQIYSYNVQLRAIELVSKTLGNIAGNRDSREPSVNADGTVVAFTSDATNLSALDTDSLSDVYLANLSENTLKIISGGLSTPQYPQLAEFEHPSISGDGTEVAFGGGYGAYSFSQNDNTTRSLVNDFVGTRSPRITELGNKIAFMSFGLLPPKFGIPQQIIAWDTKRNSFEAVLGVGDYNKGDGINLSVSSIGDTIAFDTNYSRLLPSDRNTNFDIFIVDRPDDAIGRPIVVLAGEKYTVDLPYSPAKRAVQGALYLDEDRNGVRGILDEPLADWTVYLDLNRNGRLDVSEPMQTTNASGEYAFSNLESVLEYSVVAVAKANFEPNSSETSSLQVFLPASSDLLDVDFGFVPANAGGQSTTNSKITGTVFDDLNGDGRQQLPLEKGLPDIFLKLDGTPRTARTNGSGVYSFETLGSGKQTVQLVNTEATQKNGNAFISTKFGISPAPALDFAQDVIAEDFNQDGVPDVATAMYRANKLSISLNKSAANFENSTKDILLADGASGPIAIATGRLNGNSIPDLVTANYDSGSISILMDVNGITAASIQTIKVGVNQKDSVGDRPIDVAIGDFTGDGVSDILVALSSTNLLSLLTRKPNGLYSEDRTFSSGGISPSGLITGRFNNDDNILDVAVVNNGTLGASTVSVFLGQSSGIMLLSETKSVGSGAVDITAADFDRDGIQDLATINYGNNTVSLLKGAGAGRFSVIANALSTEIGPIKIYSADIDGDNDQDILITNLSNSQSWSLFRNISVSGTIAFEPIATESLNQTKVGQRVAMAIANFDSDAANSLDLAFVSSTSKDLIVQKNIKTSDRRVQLDGNATISGIDFGVKFSPSFNDLISPAPIREDATEQTVLVSGIKAGRSNLAVRVVPTIETPSIIDRTWFVPESSERGALKFTLAANRSGQGIIRVDVIDAGTDTLPNTADDQKTTKFLTITIEDVNDPPTMTVRDSISATQKAGAQSIALFVTGITPGGGTDELSQPLSFSPAFDGSFFVVPPAISATGVLTFTPRADRSGVTLVSLTLSDTGGQLRGGMDSVTKSFAINILPVNDAPSFSLGTDITVPLSTDAKSFPNFVSNFNPGGGSDEAAQVLSEYIVDPDSSGLFLTPPSIDRSGTLRFTPKGDRAGIANITVRARDNGGTLDGGTDLSEAKSFKITLSGAATMDIRTAIGPHEIEIRNGLLVVTANGQTMQSRPAADVGKLEIIDASDTKLLEINVPVNNMPGKIRYTGVGKPIELISDRETIDLATLNSTLLFGVGIIDLRAAGANRLAFQTLRISEVNPSRTMRILMDLNDDLIAGGNWRVQTGQMVDGNWVQPYLDGTSRIEVISATPWQNKVNRFDIDGDLSVGPLDVLSLINSINDNRFGTSLLPPRNTSRFTEFYDPDGDGGITPLDVLSVINQINARGNGEGEGSIESSRGAIIDQVMANELFDFIDTQSQRRSGTTRARVR